MRDKPFGLDIGATTIKVVWLSEQKEGFFLKSSSIMPTPPKGMVSESPLDMQAMADAIKNIINETKITTPFVNIALPENQVHTKVLEMPNLSDKELSSAIYWEAEQYIPTSLSEMTLDWKVLSRPQKAETNEKMQVLLVGAPTILIDKYQKVLELSGLSINVLETEVLSVIRSIINPTELAKGGTFPNSFIIHIGAISTLFAIIRMGIIVFTYSIPVGGSAINRTIATDFGFTDLQAEEYKKVYGYSSKTLEGKIGKATEPILGSILSEVKKAISFYNEKYKESPISQVVLSGGTAKLPGIDMYFASNCGIETVTANPWKILASQQVPKAILENAPDFTIAVGLAMRDYERD